MYKGAYTKYAPDLMLLPNHGYCLRGGVGNKPVFEHDDIIQGMHTQQDAFLYVKNKENKELIPKYPCVEDVVSILNSLN